MGHTLKMCAPFDAQPSKIMIMAFVILGKVVNSLNASRINEDATIPHSNPQPFQIVLHGQSNELRGNHLHHVSGGGGGSLQRADRLISVNRTGHRCRDRMKAQIPQAKLVSAGNLEP